MVVKKKPVTKKKQRKKPRKKMFRGLVQCHLPVGYPIFVGVPGGDHCWVEIGDISRITAKAVRLAAMAKMEKHADDVVQCRESAGEAYEAGRYRLISATGVLKEEVFTVQTRKRCTIRSDAKCRSHGKE